MSPNFIANIILRGKIETLTGLHIGGSKEKLEIGGVDSPVLRDPNTNYPYIPGSSLKGKMRMLSEFSLGKIDVKNGKAGVHESKDVNDEICRIFGTSAKEVANGPTRLVIRDSYPNKKTVEMWNKLDSELQFTELKPENTIDRLTSEANPRFLERVVKGSFFNFEMIYGVYDIDGDAGKRDKDYFKYVLQALRLLEHSGLGGSVSRGYGQIKFHLQEPLLINKEDYVSNSESYKNSLSPLDVENIEFKTLDQIQELTV